MRYDAVILDHDGVLVEPPDRGTIRRVAKGAFRRLDLPPPSQEDMQMIGSHDGEKIKKLSQKYDVGGDQFFRSLEKHIIREQQREFRDEIRSSYDDIPILSEIDRPLGIVSDNPPAVIACSIRSFGMDGLFDDVYGCQFSLQGLEHKKPNPSHLQAATSELRASNPLFVGDQICDSKAAANVDIDSAHLQRERQKHDRKRPATYEINSLAQIPELLE